MCFQLSLSVFDNLSETALVHAFKKEERDLDPDLYSVKKFEIFSEFLSEREFERLILIPASA